MFKVGLSSREIASPYGCQSILISLGRPWIRSLGLPSQSRGWDQAKNRCKDGNCHDTKVNRACRERTKHDNRRLMLSRLPFKTTDCLLHESVGLQFASHELSHRQHPRNFTFNASVEPSLLLPAGRSGLETAIRTVATGFRNAYSVAARQRLGVGRHIQSRCGTA